MFLLSENEIWFNWCEFQRNAYHELSYIIELEIRLPSQSNYSFNYNIAGMRKGIHKSFLLHWLNITCELFMEFIDCATMINSWFLYYIAKFIDFKNQLFQLISQPICFVFAQWKIVWYSQFHKWYTNQIHYYWQKGQWPRWTNQETWICENLCMLCKC